MIVCGSTIWSLWLARESMFNGKRWDSVEIFNLIHTRSLFWTKACDGMGSVAEYGWWSEPGNLNIAHAPLHTSVNITWQPPQLEGYVKGLFCSTLGVQDSNYAEIMAIKHALCMYASSPNAGNDQLVVESDSIVPLTWVEKVNHRPWNIWHIFNEIDTIRATLGRVISQHIMRDGNSYADMLANHGFDCESMFTAWW
ncbi:Uncharacterized protein TCM_014308 [Theobroma cacao]|uniref:RNase H type-1 domain-containing protein n=1 Tax=Theobroma cacao TaxID=3641 RepID=A0A061FX74_THECC|nr:Uncharacterized protein TCM_014308 [Theobroma cacao]